MAVVVRRVNGFSPLRQQGEFLWNHESVTLFQVFPHQILLLFKPFLLINYNFNCLNYIFNLIYNISLLPKLIRISIGFLIALKKMILEIFFLIILLSQTKNIKKKLSFY